MLIEFKKDFGFIKIYIAGFSNLRLFILFIFLYLQDQKSMVQLNIY